MSYHQKTWMNEWMVYIVAQISNLATTFTV